MDETLSRIDYLMGRIRTHPEYSNHVRRDFTNSLISEADRHSLALERIRVPTFEMDKSSRNMKKPTKSRDQCYKRLEEARAYLIREGVGVVSLSSLGHIIQAFNEEEGSSTPNNYRSSDVKFGSFYGVNVLNIHQEVNNLTYFINHASGLHPVVKASLSHLDFVRIHPYIDGNGRAARLLQDLVLERNDLPPAIIPENERDHYLSIISNALIEVIKRQVSPITISIDNISQSEKSFQTYISSKVLDSVLRLEEKLRSDRYYLVELKGVCERPMGIAIVDTLRSMANKRGHTIKASLVGRGRKKCVINVNGDMSLEEISSFFGKIGKRYKIGFNVASLR